MILIGTNCLVASQNLSQSSKLSILDKGDASPDYEEPSFRSNADSLQNYIMIPDYSYLWVDATDGIRCSIAGQDDANQLFYFPFSFSFYNIVFNSFYVCTNGFVSFVSRTTWANVPFPSSTYTYMVAPFWDDLIAANPCNIFVKNLSNCVVVEWQNYYTLGGSLVGTFELIFFNSGDIIFNYDYLDYASSYTCGLNFGIDTQFFNSFTNLNTSMDNFAIKFRYYTPPSQILYSIMIMSNVSIFLSDVKIASSITSGDDLRLLCSITSPLNICKVIALIQNEKIQIIAILNLYDDGNHNDGGAHDGIFGSAWSSSNAPLETYQVNLLVADNKNIGKVFNNIATFSIIPTFLSQYSLLIWIIIGISVLLVEALLLIRYRPKEIGTQIKRVLPKWKKINEPKPLQPEILKHKSGERPYNVGISLNSCPNCGKDLPLSTQKQLGLGYRVYCPTEGCFYPLFTVATVQEKVPENIEPPKIREKLPDISEALKILEQVPENIEPLKIQEKLPDTSDASKIREKVPEPSKPIKPAQDAIPPPTAITPKLADLRQCPHCNHPLTDTQLKLKQTGRKVMCRNCLELV